MYIVQKLIKSYSDKYLPKELDIHGLKLYHKLEPNFDISWNMENPSDLSYNVEVIKGFLDDRMSDFSKLSNIDLRQYRFHYNLKKLNIEPSFYLNKQDETEIKKNSDSIKSIFFKGVKLSVKIDKIKFSFGYDWVRMEVSFIVHDVYRKIEDNFEKTEEDFDELFERLYLDEDFHQNYIYTLMDPVSSIVWNNPTIVDDSYMYLEIHYGFKLINE